MAPSPSAGPRRPRTLVVGLTGLPASGKSAAAVLLEGLGAVRVDADRLAHGVLDRPAVRRRVEAALGLDLRRRDGRTDRAALAAAVFGRRGGPALRRLTDLLHPEVRRGLRAAVAGARRAGAPAVVLEVPLLFEAGVDRLCDVTVFVDAPRAARLARARTRGWTAAELRAREARQWPAARRRRRADRILANGGDRRALRREVRVLWDRLRGGGTAGS